MQSFILVAFFACLAVANAGVVVAPSARIIQGPSSRTTIAGPDGSVIHSEQPGSTIVQEDGATLVAAPALAYSAAYSAPITYSSPLSYSASLAYSAPLTYSSPLAYSAHSVVAPTHYASTYTASLDYAAPLAYSASAVFGSVDARSVDNTVIAGPSGTVSTSKVIDHPAATVVAAPGVVAAF